MTTTPPQRADAGTTDAGLGLVELVVAMLVLTVALLTLVPVQTRALGGVVLAEERQRATGYANQALERVRARTATTAGFDAVVAGRLPAASDAADTANTTGCPSACRFRPSADPSRPVEVLRAATSPDASLVTQRCSEQSGCVSTGTVHGLQFTTRLYVTPTADSRLVNVTAITEWTSSNSRSGRHQVAVRTQVGSPVVA